MQIVGIGTILVSRSRRLLDLALTGLLAASALQFLSKPFLALALGGWGANPQVYLDSAYAMISQSLGSVFGIAIALMMLAVLVSDILAAAMQKSETDTLSGLLNRRGFETRAEMRVGDATRQGISMSLVICDIDHFKAVNDSLGHASGDRVITAFAGFLGSAASSHYVVGRIGGEEFAVILPGANLLAARLFAESARSAFASLCVDGLPQDRRFTASFGVAELAPGESLTDLLIRADAALYEAKNNGRDCVRVSQLSMAQVPRQLAG
jgi:diguanylate cyclase (GGDEF)-like protein